MVNILLKRHTIKQILTAPAFKPLLAHLAEPIAAWLPLDPESVHYRYYSNNPEWHVYGREGFPSHETILAARDRILEKHPRLTVIGVGRTLAATSSFVRFQSICR